MDSSGSLRNDYQREKDFLKTLAGAIGISQDGSRASVLTFSSNSELSIKFSDHFNQSSFDDAVDSIPLMGQTTRIDTALRLAQNEMFTEKNGANSNLPNILILLTDGTQTKDVYAENPTDIAAEIRASGINLIVVGIGKAVNQNELDNMAGGPQKAYSVASFDELVGRKFIKQLTEKSCEVGMYVCMHAS